MKRSSFWNKLERPILCMAPMEDVTDIAFRQMFTKYSRDSAIGNKFVSFTEFVSADGLVLAPEEGRKQLLSKLQFKKNERPIVAQIFGAQPENIQKAAKLVTELAFDGVDINMGCPDRSVEKGGAGAALIKSPELAVKIIDAAKAEAKDLPLSIKTRIGYNDVSLDWIETMLAQKLDVLTIHLRTRKEMSNHVAHWELMPDILKLRDKISPKTLVIGNGDVKSVEDVQEKVKQYGCDGVMIGRGLFGKPDFFADNALSTNERLRALVEHLRLFDKYLLSKEFKGYHVMKKHFKAYVTDFDGAKELRVELMDTSSPKEAEQILNNYLV